FDNQYAIVGENNQTELGGVLASKLRLNLSSAQSRSNKETTEIDKLFGWRPVYLREGRARAVLGKVRNRRAKRTRDRALFRLLETDARIRLEMAMIGILRHHPIDETVPHIHRLLIGHRKQVLLVANLYEVP